MYWMVTGATARTITILRSQRRLMLLIFTTDAGYAWLLGRA